ncbi:hypothetical protein HPB50_027044 [Hyalomma asiaticum]|uniref:Uncharacterized protein n=1 Tax=Hyalomma asiaticum TaxID=266040 RepID=A0ACB7RQR3_HYAAI|nr:hypothetical protein HPB50_027044 [Hyalomma asiaticum]
MDRAAATSATVVGTTRGLLVWQWNWDGFARKKAVLQQHLEQTTVRPDVIVLQETLTEEVKLPGYTGERQPAEPAGHDRQHR